MIEDKKQKLLAIVITYNPDAKLLIEGIRRYIDDVDKLIVWENTPESTNEQYRSELKSFHKEQYDKIEFFSTGKNEFIAYPLNYAIDFGINNEYTHLLTMDQDSLYEVGSVKKLMEDSLSYGSNSIFTPYILSDGILKPRPDGIQEIVQSITSGTIYPLQIFKNVGYFREDFKIDYVDFEFSFRARKSGIKTFVDGDATLYQNYGDIKKETIGYTTNYSPIRLYYQTRNRIIFIFDTKGEAPIIRTRKMLIRQIPKIIFFENNKIKKLTAILRGVKDGFIYRFRQNKKLI